MLAQTEIKNVFVLAILAVSISACGGYKVETAASDQSANQGTTPSPTPAPTPTPAPVAASGQPPLSANDPMFAANVLYTGGNEINLPDGGSVVNKDVKGSPVQTASVVCGNPCTIDHARLISDEGVRVGEGTTNISNTFIDTTALPDDHADGLQAYDPGATGAINMTNVTFQSHAGSNSGMFIADGWMGTITLNNVLFIGDGGNRAFDVYPDGGDIHLSFTNVYIVGPWLYGDFDMKGTGGHNVVIDQWKVYDATIVNGVLVPGSPIPCPAGNGVICN